MKMKNENHTHRVDSNRGRSAAAGPVFWFCVLCFTLLPLRLVTSVVGVASANPAAEVSAESAQSGPAVAVDPNSPEQRELWRAEISVVPGRQDDESSNELRRLIERVRSVTFEPRRPVVEPVVVPVETPAIERKEPPSDEKAAAEQVLEKAAPKPKLPYEPISEKTLAMLRDLSKHPEKVNNPFELGETLFLSGNLKEAVVFYSEALNRTEPNDVDPSGNRAWMLFQSGNCLRNSDRPAAAKMYALLVTQYPDSEWAQMAQAQVQLIGWYLQDEPDKLIAKKEQTGEQ